LEARIDKILHEAFFQLEFDLDQGIDRENLFIILKFLDYATAKDELYVTTEVFDSLLLDSLLSWVDLKFLLAAIEGIYLP